MIVGLYDKTDRRRIETVQRVVRQPMKKAAKIDRQKSAMCFMC